MSVSSWLMQAKEVTKKISEFMYIPAEDFDEEQNDQAVAPPEVDVSTTIGTQVVDNFSLPDLKIGIPDQSTETNDDLSFLEGNAVETAKKMANSFLLFAKEATLKAAATAEETAKMLQNVVAEKTIIGDLDRERDKFDLEVCSKKLATGTLPWADLPDQWIAKKQILALSLDSRNFLRDPPTETNFDFTQMQPTAAILLEEDPSLQKIRYELVPKQLSEKRFWRNYFYRVSLIRQSALSNRLASDPACSAESAGNNPLQEKKNENTTDAIAETRTENQKDNVNQKPEKNRKQKAASEEDWEKELVNDFDDYELVCEKTDPNWEEIEKCIDST